MNHGYADAEGTRSLDLEPEDEPNRYPIQLYHHVAAAIDWRGLDGLEVGCGRGGGTSYVMRRFEPRSLVGLDLTESAISFCDRQYALPGLSFRRGDAQRLPFEAESFDVVLNVESSGSYEDKAAFFAEVARVLRPGGYFLFADYRRRQGAEKLRNQLARTDLHSLGEQDISENIRRALILDDARKRRLIEKHVPRPLRATVGKFAFVLGGKDDELGRFERGEKVYLSFVMQKPNRAAADAERERP